MSDTTIRPVEPFDLDDLTDLFVRCFNAPPWSDGWSHAAARERLDAILSAKTCRGVIARNDAGVIGMALGQKERWVDGYHYQLQEMCVDLPCQRQGIGLRLLDGLQRVLVAEGVEKLYLITAPDAAAEAFYASRSFRRSRGRVVMVSDLKM